MVSVRYVLANGTRAHAKRRKNSELFWASCGGGGGNFGIAYEFKFKLRDRSPYDRSVYYRVDWPKTVAAEVAHAYSQLDLSSGRFVMKLKSDFSVIPPVIRSFGACWEVDTAAECEALLNNTLVFAVPGRITRVMRKAQNVLEVVKFLGKSGNYGQKIPKATDEQAFLNERFGAASNSNPVRWASVILKYPSIPPLSFYQALVDFCGQNGVGK